ncbi:MAG: leucine-rich repeat protein [Paludibacter sp.]|nr:leucine-rich repeat protein [Paludibacter sp.]
MKKIIIILFALMLTSVALLAQTWNIGTPNAASVTATISGSGINLTLTISGTGAMQDFTLDENTLACSAPWYNNKNDIKTLILNPGITNIGNYAFYNISLTSALAIPSSVTTIGDYAFYRCNGLTGTLTIPNGVTAIGNYAFYNCSSLTGALTIPNGVSAIGNSTFYNCSGLTGTLTISNGVSTIGNYAFYNCNGLTGTLTIPNAVTAISSYAFYNCVGFTGTLIIPNNVTAIGIYAFYNCIGFSGTLTIPNNVAIIGSTAFSRCSGITAINVASTNANYSSTNGILYNKTKTVLVCYPAGKTGAFTIPNGVITIGNNAFMSCAELTSVVIPSGVTVIGDTAFSACTALTSVMIPSTVTRIGNHAFRNCNLLALPVLPSNLSRIGNSAFYGCTNLIGNLILPSTVTYIGSNAFFNCAGLVGELVLPAALDTLHSSSFMWCSGFSGPLILPNNLRFIGAEPFSLCDGIISATVTLTIPESVFYIGFHSFRGFNHLETINFNPINCLTMVDELDTTRLAFRDCNAVKTINIGANVTKIPNYGFAGLSNIEQINSNAITPPTIYLRTFRNIDTNIPVNVPCDVSAYQAAQYWSFFPNFNAVGVASIPYNLQATTGQAGIELQWYGDAANYNIYRNNILIATVSTTTYTDTENLPQGSYCYQIHVKNTNEVCPDAVSNEVCINITSVYDMHIQHFKIYPIPAKDIIFIESDINFTDIKIFDIYGRVVLSAPKAAELNIANLAQGSYIVSIINNGITIERVKIFKD